MVAWSNSTDTPNMRSALMAKNKMTKEAAARIQSLADRTGRNKDFARRAQSAADRRVAQRQSQQSGGGNDN